MGAVDRGEYRQAGRVTTPNVIPPILMSAIGGKADITRTRRDVCLWHKADITGCAANVRFWGNSGHEDMSALRRRNAPLGMSSLSLRNTRPARPRRVVQPVHNVHKAYQSRIYL